MQTKFERFELKYFITEDEVSRLKTYVFPFMKADPYTELTGGNSYTVRSIYYDTWRLRFYSEKIDGLKRRRKLRIRTYNEHVASSVASFEIKNKISSSCLKERALIQYESMLHLMDDSMDRAMPLPNLSRGEKLSLEKFLFLKDYMNLEPSVLVTYEREPYIGQLDSKIRVTFDRNIRGIERPGLDQLFAESGFRHLETDKVILELKFNNLMPAWLKKAVMGMSLYSRPISKYCNCIDLWNDYRYLS